MDSGFIWDVEMGEDGWAQIKHLPGWDGFDLYVKSGRVGGEPRIVGVRLEPQPGAEPADVALTQVRLRRLPLAELAPVVYRLANLQPSTLSDLMAVLTTAADEITATPDDPRQVADVERVAGVYMRALEAGVVAPRKAVCTALTISPRTADRYISKARQQGLLPHEKGKEGGSA